MHVTVMPANVISAWRDRKQRCRNLRTFDRHRVLASSRATQSGHARCARTPVCAGV